MSQLWENLIEIGDTELIINFIQNEDSCCYNKGK